MSNNNIITMRENQQSRIEMQELRRDEFIGILGVWGPIAIPLIPASLTAIAIATHYPELLSIGERFAIGLGIIAAGGIEVLGIVSTETFLQMRSYNQMRDDGDEPAPTVAAGIVAAAYLAVVMALVVLLKVWPAFAIYSLLPLTALGALVSWIVVLRRQHSKRELVQLQRRIGNDEIANVKLQNEELQNERAEWKRKLQIATAEFQNEIAKLQNEIVKLQREMEIATCNTRAQGTSETKIVAQPLPKSLQITEVKPEIATDDPILQRQTAILQLFRAYGEMSISELQDRLQNDCDIEASDRTLRTDLQALVDSGELVKSGRGRWDVSRTIADELPAMAAPVLNGVAH